MMTRVKTAALAGVRGVAVTVETDIRRGMPAFNIVGLADITIKEAYQRVRPAIFNSGYGFPCERITVNLVPAGSHKTGSHFDLPIAMGIIMAEEGDWKTEDTVFLGELSLDGKINPIKGALPLAISARENGAGNIVVPAANAEEVSILEDVRVIPVENLSQAVDYACGLLEGKVYKGRKAAAEIKRSIREDFSQVVGQESVKRALAAAAAGNHGILMIGGPGCGKTMMAKRMPGILPPLDYEERLEVTGIYSVAGLLSEERPWISDRPFRKPHHSASRAGIIGGGTRPAPGELTLAHRGIIFMDELGEFDERVLDSMREPLEEGVVRIRRNTEEVTFPAEAMVVAAANPCRCGNLWNEKKICTCTERQLAAYRRKLSGPFSDRIDIHVKVNPVSREEISGENTSPPGMSSEEMRILVERARRMQSKRYINYPKKYNGNLSYEEAAEFCVMDEGAGRLIGQAYHRLNLTARAYGKLVKVARTLADMEESEVIRERHAAEAAMYRITEGTECYVR